MFVVYKVIIDGTAVRDFERYKECKTLEEAGEVLKSVEFSEDDEVSYTVMME